jgi:hypothetical protein
MGQKYQRPRSPGPNGLRPAPYGERLAFSAGRQNGLFSRATLKEAEH